MKNFHRISCLLLALVFAFSFAGCGQSDDKAAVTSQDSAAISTTAAASASGDSFESKKWVIGLSQEGLDHPYMITQRKQIMDAAAKYENVKVIATDGQNNVAKQVAGIEDMISQGANIILVEAAKAEGLKEELAKVHAAGIPFLFVGKPIKGTDAITMISNDNFEIGKQAGQFIVDRLTKKNGSAKGNIILIEGIPGDQTSEDRIGGAKEVLKAYPDIKILAQQPGKYRRPDALSVMQNLLQANAGKTIDLVYACSGEMALGVVQAVKDAGKTGIDILGLDGQQEELDSIKAGDETATWRYMPCGTEGFDTAIKILKGEKVEPVIVVPTEAITKDNVDKMEPAF